jgi:anti-sigma factor RsiW
MTPMEERVEEPAGSEAGRRLWQRCQGLLVSYDEAERFLDLAAFADGRIEDEDERARVAEIVATDASVRADVAAASALSSGGIAMAGGLDRIVARAAALVSGRGVAARLAPAVIPQPVSRLRGAAQWSALAAAIALTGWFGFWMGSDASQTLTASPSVQQQVGDESFLPELLDPATGFLRDLSGRQT